VVREGLGAASMADGHSAKNTVNGKTVVVNVATHDAKNTVEREESALGVIRVGILPMW
jgi:hypothetical protein